MSILAFIPSPPSNGFHVGPLFFHAYGLCYVVAAIVAVAIAVRRWETQGGERELVYEVALWAFPAGLIGGRLYFIVTSWNEMPPHWWGVFAVWKGGLGIWGGVAAGVAVGIWRLRRRGADVALFMDAAAPALLVAQAIGRVGNYFNQELFGLPTTLPWGLQISAAHRPLAYAQYATFNPTFLYELIWDLLLAGALVWLGQASPQDQRARLVRALRGRLLVRADRRGAAAHRPRASHLRAAAELLRGEHPLRGRNRLVRPHPAGRHDPPAVAQDAAPRRRAAGCRWPARAGRLRAGVGPASVGAHGTLSREHER